MHQHAGEVGAEHRSGVGEPAAVADGVDRRLRRGECPQPVAHGVHTPAGLIRCDHRTVADLLAQRRVGRRRRGRPCVCSRWTSAARRHRQAELRLQMVTRPSPAASPSRCAPRPPCRQPRSGRAARRPRPAHRRSATGGGPALDADTASSGPPRSGSAERSVRSCGTVFLILRRRRGSPRPRPRSPDTPTEPAPHASRQPGTAGGGIHACP